MRLGFVYIDSGAMYRGVTLAILRAGIDPHDRESVERLAASLDIYLRCREDGSLQLFLNGQDVSSEIRSLEVTANVSLISSYPGVRRHLVALQQKMGEEGGVVLDGRDIGTVVFPDADVKIFMVADLHARAERRKSELETMGTEVPVDGLEAQLAERDRLDSTREASPLRKADDALEIDTSNLTIDGQVERVVELARRKLERG
jgi:cytidylate kinase